MFTYLPKNSAAVDKASDQLSGPLRAVDDLTYLSSSGLRRTLNGLVYGTFVPMY